MASQKSLSPKETSIILFPGQGNQYVGMGKDLIQYPAAKKLFEVASEILGFDLLDVCLNGPIEKLTLTKYCQPAIVVTSLAALEKLKEENPNALKNCIATAGYSIGEYSALVLAGSLTFEEAIRIVKARSEAMHGCTERAKGGMLSCLLGADSKKDLAIKDAKEHCTKLGIENPECAVSNYLYASAQVISGHVEALDFIAENAEKYNILKTVRLPMAGAYHTKLMEPASAAIQDAFSKTSVKEPTIYVHNNIDGKRYQDAGQIAKFLPLQVFLAVNWEQTINILYENSSDLDYPSTYELGAGSSLTKMLAKVNPKAAQSAFNVSV